MALCVAEDVCFLVLQGIPGSAARRERRRHGCAWVPESCATDGNGNERTTETGRQRNDPSGISTMPRSSAACWSSSSFIWAKKRASTASSSRIGSSKETSGARSCRCRAGSVDRSIAVSRERCLCDGHFVANLRPTGAASRKCPTNPFFNAEAQRARSRRELTRLRLPWRSPPRRCVPPRLRVKNKT
jgi:hypothetical protein